VLSQQVLRPVDGELERLARTGREVDELDERLILDAADIGKAFNLPGEQVIEPLEKLDVPRLRLRDGQLRERGIRVDENLARDARVLVAPEPGSAQKIEKMSASAA
jgi:hypothetical protein